MIRDITLGQYYQTESVIHRLDPRTKLLGTLVYLISLFIFTKPWVFATAAVFLLLVLVLSRVPLKFMLKGLRPIIFILLFTIIVNMFWIKGTVLVSWWKLSITVEGLKQAGSMGTRLILLILHLCEWIYSSTTIVVSLCCHWCFLILIFDKLLFI